MDLLKEFVVLTSRKAKTPRNVSEDPASEEDAAGEAALNRREAALRAELHRKAEDIQTLSLGFLSLVPEEHQGTAWAAILLFGSALMVRGAAESPLASERDLRVQLVHAEKILQEFRTEYTKLAPSSRKR